MTRLKDILNELPNKFTLHIDFVYCDYELHEIKNKETSEIVKAFQNAIVVEKFYDYVVIAVCPHDTETEYESIVTEYIESKY